MYKIYLKQAIQILKQNMFMSIIAIVGTALAITMIMAIIVSEQIKNISVAPEINRNRTYYISAEYSGVENGSRSLSSIHYETVWNYIYNMEIPEIVSAYMGASQKYKNPVKVEGERKLHEFTIRATDAAYWKILSIPAINGRHYTQEEFESGMNHAVISRSTARKLFGDMDPIGKIIDVEFRPYNVIGIVDDVSPVFTIAYSEIWIPYTSEPHYTNVGAYHVMLLASSTKDYPAIYEELRNVEKKIKSDKSLDYEYLNGPFNHKIAITDPYKYSEEEVTEEVKIANRKMIFILCLLILIPALNLTGISLSRIRKRTSEIGVRKAFGAKKHIILIQVLYETLITSLIGGIMGLGLSYLVVVYLKDWLLKLPSGSAIPLNTLLSPMVFIAVFIICILISLLSAGIPAYKASKVNIINSINQNERK